MKVSTSDSGIDDKRGQGSFPWIDLMLETETDTEKALLRALRSGSVSFNVWSTGNATIRFRLPRAPKQNF